MAFGLTASADDVVYDGDGDTPVAANSATLALGNVCTNGTYVDTMLVAIKRFWQDADGSNDPLRVFKNDASLTMSIPSAITGSHAANTSATLTDSSIVLPSNWLDTTAYPKGTVYETDMAVLEVTVNVQASPGNGEANIPLRASGRNSTDTATIIRNVTSKVTWTAVTCPTVTINSVTPNPVTPADSTFDVNWQADQTGTYEVRVGGTDCTTGTVEDSGNYPTANTAVDSTLDATDLAYGANDVRVCVTSTNGTGSDTETVYRQVPTTLTYSGQTTYVSSTPLAILMKGTLSDSQTACNVNGQPIDFYVDLNNDGNFQTTEKVADDINTAGGSNNSSTAQFTTAALAPGLYLVRVEYAGSNTCAASSDESVVAIVNPNDAANGGGWYQITGQTGASKSVNFGFTTKWDRQLSQYRGQLLVHNKQAWRMKGEILGFARLTTGTSFPKPAEATGTASLQCWDTALETWKTADESVTFKIKFTDVGTPSKKAGATKLDKFTVYYVTSYTPQNSCPSAVSPLVQTTEQLLKGGNVFVK